MDAGRDCQFVSANPISLPTKWSVLPGTATALLGATSILFMPLLPMSSNIVISPGAVSEALA